MRRCPKCGTTYTDETLRYCLADGSVLDNPGEQATLAQPAAGETVGFVPGGQVRVDIPQGSPPSNYTAAKPAETSGPSTLKIVLVVGLFAGLLVVGLVGAVALIYFNKDSRTSEPRPVIMPANQQTQTPAANSETERLREAIANLEKRLNEQKNTNSPAYPDTPAPPDQPTVTSSTARVNSPGDGFLALRSLPDSDKGERILQIPHGAAVTINGCLPRTRIGSKTGRWCRANYGSYNGWVFDAWLIY